MSRRDLGFRAIFGAPLAVAVLSLTGLVGALLADGAWDWIGAGLLASTIIVVAGVRLRAGLGERAPGPGANAARRQPYRVRLR